jgi:signal recognition particle receptor subunit beta
MVLFNAATKELTAKIVYYGPGLCGKTTNLQNVYDALPQEGRGKMLSLATQTDRTLFFDFLPIELGTIRGMKTRIQLYTVPGQVFYDATRKLVLRGADAVVFVADSQAQALDGNKESFQNLIDNLKEQGSDLEKLPHVIQFNKRDTPNALPVDVLERELNRFGAPTFEACATQGRGVRETIKGVALLVLRHLAEKYGGGAAETPAGQLFSQAPGLAGTLDSIRATGSGPLEVEDLGAGEMLEEIEEFPETEAGGVPGAGTGSHGASVVEVPVVLDRSLFTGDTPVEIRLKLYLK